MRTVNVVLVTRGARQPALLSVESASGDGQPVLMVGSVARHPEDLPADAYLEVAEPEVADQAVMAGYALEPPHTVKRRRYAILGKIYGLFLFGGTAGSLFWAVRDALELDLLRALAWVGLAAFCAVLGLGWWIAGEDTMLGEEAANRSKARRFRRALSSRIRRR